jgi:WD40 repeat protein
MHAAGPSSRWWASLRSRTQVALAACAILVVGFVVYWASPSKQRTALPGLILHSTSQVWDATNGQELLTLDGHEGSVNSVAWSPDGKRLATGSDDKTAKVWDAASGDQLLIPLGYTGPVHSVAWSPDGKRLANGGSEAQ